MKPRPADVRHDFHDFFQLLYVNLQALLVPDLDIEELTTIPASFSKCVGNVRFGNCTKLFTGSVFVAVARAGAFIGLAFIALAFIALAFTGVVTGVAFLACFIALVFMALNDIAFMATIVNAL